MVTGIVCRPVLCCHVSPVTCPLTPTSTHQWQQHGKLRWQCGSVATSQPAPSATTSTSQQPHYYRPPQITASSNSNRTSGGNGNSNYDNDDGLRGIVPPSL